MNFVAVLNCLLNKQDLETSVCYSIISDFLEKKISSVQFASFLSLLKAKGETSDEIYATVQVLRKHMTSIDLDIPILVDTCGTGGDQKSTFNISTLSSFVVSGCGIPVVKHGNRSVSSQCGSADIVEHLGLDLFSSIPIVKNALKEIGFTFLFAPLYHPAFKMIAPVRKELGIPSIFNFIGPLLNPCNPNVQIMGVPDMDTVDLISVVWEKLHCDDEFSGCLVSERGYDEIVLLGSFQVRHFYQKKWHQYTFSPSDFGLKTYQENDITFSGNREQYIRLFLDILSSSRHKLQDIVIMNAGIAIYAYHCMERNNINIDWMYESVNEAKESIQTGRAYRQLQRFLHLEK